MKKLIGLLLLVLLVGCGNVQEDLESHLETMKTHAETRTDLEGYINDLKAFNTFLESVEDNKYSDYVKTQLEANNTRIEALETKDVELITDSSFLQAKAIQLYEELKESE